MVVAASSWKVWEGVRELVQNWHDGLLQTQEKVLEALAARDPELKRRIQRGSAPNMVLSYGRRPRSSETGAGAGAGAGAGGGTGSRARSGQSDGSRASATGPPVASSLPPFTVAAVVAGRQLGWLQYLPKQQSLVVVNRDVGLSRKVLLLGYSSKAKHRDVIGSVVATCEVFPAAGNVHVVCMCDRAECLEKE